MILFGIILLGFITSLVGVGSIISYRRNRAERRRNKENERRIGEMKII
jgi:hypothetical protein